MSQFNDRFASWLWKLRVLLKAGLPDFRIGAGESLPHVRKASSIRIAPARNGQPATSFWSIWRRGNEIYAAGRSHIGVHKLSFHSSGRWFSTLGNSRRKLAPRHALPGGQWFHALELRFLIGEGILPPLPEKPFREADPGYTVEVAPGEHLVVHLLIGAHGTKLDAALPNGFDWPRLLELVLRDGMCAVVLGAPFKMPDNVRRVLQIARALRLQSKSAPDFQRLRLEVFQVEITSEGFNRVTVIPLGPEAITTKPRSSSTRVP
ncbi:MAG: hypothetical protein AB7Q00_16040 [Phycisphaerales bacterium]